MLIKNISISLFLGIVYLFISTSILPSIHLWIQLILLPFIPLPILLAILYFPFWIAIVAFVPVVCLMFFDLSYAFNINVLFTLPLLIIFILIHFKTIRPGIYIPLVIIGYSALFFAYINYYFSLHNISLPDRILDTVNILAIYINNYFSDLSFLKTNFERDIFVFLVPTIFVLNYYLIIIANYVIANWLVNRKNINYFKLQVGHSLPSFYIYIFIIYIIAILILNYILKIDINNLYVLYNIAVMFFIPFSVSGIGVLNYIIHKNKLILFLFIIILLFANLHIILLLCFVGFLKEAKVFNIRLVNKER